MVKPTLASEPHEGPCRRRELDKEPASASGEFFTLLSIVKLIVEIIEPFHGRIYDSR